MAKQLIIATELSAEHQLRHFIRFRWGLIAFTATAAGVGWLFTYPVSSWPLIGLLLLTHISTNLILKFIAHPKRLSQIYTVSCCLDIVLLGCLLLLSGGASNGLVALLLLPVAVAAVMLPGKVCYLIAMLAVAAYSTLLFIGDLTIPNVDQLLQQAEYAQHSAHSHHGSAGAEAFNQHLLQMWWAFTLSALLISWFINSQANLIRLKSRKISELQQQQVRHEHMLALATFAANAAHDLASPIQTLQLLADELQVTQATMPALTELKTELTRCQHIVQQLRQDAGSLRSDQQQAPLLLQTEQQLDHWLNSRPDINLKISKALSAADFSLSDSQGYSAALINILDNAADASVANQCPQLTLTLSLDPQGLTVSIQDFGEGLSPGRLAELGQLPQQSEQGLGIGQFLANVSIERLGGTVQRQSLENGTLTVLTIPRPPMELP
ncbi:ATP-binding protein [Arsukibacterium ikkense]|nr:ATP-binding protein [Arsukibacterium ikkense]